MKPDEAMARQSMKGPLMPSLVYPSHMKCLVDLHYGSRAHIKMTLMRHQLGVMNCVTVTNHLIAETNEKNESSTEQNPAVRNNKSRFTNYRIEEDKQPT